MAIRSFLALVLATGTARQASAVVFPAEIDPAQSQLTLSGAIIWDPNGNALALPFQEQAAGSLVTDYAGTFFVDVTLTAGVPTQIAYLASDGVTSSTLDPLVNGTWQPGIGGEPGESAPADYGIFVPTGALPPPNDPCCQPTDRDSTLNFGLAALRDGFGNFQSPFGPSTLTPQGPGLWDHPSNEVGIEIVQAVFDTDLDLTFRDGLADLLHGLLDSDGDGTVTPAELSVIPEIRSYSSSVDAIGRVTDLEFGAALIPFLPAQALNEAVLDAIVRQTGPTQFEIELPVSVPYGIMTGDPVIDNLVTIQVALSGAILARIPEPSPLALAGLAALAWVLYRYRCVATPSHSV